MSDDAVLEWLLAGDPVIRWQVLRDLLDEPAEIWEEERRRALESGGLRRGGSRARQTPAAWFSVTRPCPD